MNSKSRYRKSLGNDQGTLLTGVPLPGLYIQLCEPRPSSRALVVPENHS